MSGLHGKPAHSTHDDSTNAEKGGDGRDSDSYEQECSPSYSSLSLDALTDLVKLDFPHSMESFADDAFCPIPSVSLVLTVQERLAATSGLSTALGLLTKSMPSLRDQSEDLSRLEAGVEKLREAQDSFQVIRRAVQDTS